jgi:hypothetical protein
LILVVDGLKSQRNMELIISPIIPKILANNIVVIDDTNIYNNNTTANKRRRALVNHEECNVPFGEWGGKCGALYKDSYSWSAKNLRKAMTEIGFKESEWNQTVDICLQQLEISKAFDKIHRFWITKQ